MSTSPTASQYQGSVDPGSTFQPTINSSDSDYSDEQSARSQYQQTYGTQGNTSSSSGQTGSTSVAAYPNLSMAYTTAPDFYPLDNLGGGGGGDGSTSAPETQFPIQLNFAALRSTETTFLSATQALVDDYENTLMPLVRNAIGSNSIFGQLVGTSRGITPDSIQNAQQGDPIVSNGSADQLDSEGTDFAAAVNPQMSKLLQSVGNIIEAFGAFTANINAAGQYYAGADGQSIFPVPGLMEGPTDGAYLSQPPV